MFLLDSEKSEARGTRKHDEIIKTSTRVQKFSTTNYSQQMHLCCDNVEQVDWLNTCNQPQSVLVFANLKASALSKRDFNNHKSPDAFLYHSSTTHLIHENALESTMRDKRALHVPFGRLSNPGCRYCHLAHIFLSILSHF